MVTDYAMTVQLKRKTLWSELAPTGIAVQMLSLCVRWTQSASFERDS